jgi:hypothetical protein
MIKLPNLLCLALALFGWGFSANTVNANPARRLFHAGRTRRYNQDYGRLREVAHQL